MKILKMIFMLSKPFSRVKITYETWLRQFKDVRGFFLGCTKDMYKVRDLNSKACSDKGKVV